MESLKRWGIFGLLIGIAIGFFVLWLFGYAEPGSSLADHFRTRILGALIFGGGFTFMAVAFVLLTCKDSEWRWRRGLIKPTKGELK